MTLKTGNHFSGETCYQCCEILRRRPPVHLTWPHYGEREVHQALPVPGFDFGHRRPRPLPAGDLRTLEFLGLSRVFRAFADLSQPGLLDILVHGEPHRDRGGAQPAQTRHSVTTA